MRTPFLIMPKKNPWAVDPESLPTESTLEAVNQRGTSPVETKILESMSTDELKELAKVKRIKVHHRAGRQKLLEALRGKDQA